MTSEELNAWTSTGTLIGLIVVGIMNRIDARKAAKVRNNIHVLVNGNLGLKLKRIAILSRQVYRLTKDSKDEQVAIEAEQDYQLHSVKQAVAEAQAVPPPESG